MSKENSTSDIHAIGIIGSCFIIWLLAMIAFQELSGYFTSLAIGYDNDQFARYAFISLAICCLLIALYMSITGGIVALGLAIYLISKVWFERYRQFVDYIGRIFFFRWIKIFFDEFSRA